MTSGIDLINCAGEIAGLTIALMCLLLAVFSRYMETRERGFFMVFFLILTAYVLSDLISEISLVFLGEEYVLLSKITLFLASLFSSMLLPMICAYLLHCADEVPKHNLLLYTSCILWVVYAALLGVTQFTEWIYYFTPDNDYHRGPYYPALLIPPAAMMLLNLIGVFRRKKKLTPMRFKGFLAYILIPLGCMLIQMVSYGLFLIEMGTAVAALIFFIFIVREQTDHFVRQRLENTNQRLNIAILQMRPHFIYNTMTSIYYLVQQDSARAQQMIEDFTNYLRKNFTAIAANEPILFAEELEHTKAYLAVEQVRFEGKLYVKYVTEVTDFRLPPLTLQPLVENAVKHGVDPDLDPVTITVRTSETEDQIRLTVEDTGLGFHREENDNPKGALDNIRERLELMCGGSLSIMPRERGGTIVMICLPKEGKKNSHAK
ncbi:MAG: histidine kinase [Lachnospiraceae bacterium]|nr:histidine kinase [Lachnospiraceae bacterium]